MHPTKFHHLLRNLTSNTPFLVLTFLISSICVHKILRKKMNKPTKTPPSPPKLPILGNLHQLGDFPHRTLFSMSQKYGEFMMLQLGSKPTLVISSANAAKEIMKTHDVIFSDRPQSTLLCKLFYNYRDIAFSKYGEYWRQMKSLCVLKLLSNSRVRSFRNVREEGVCSMVKKIKKLSSEVDLSEVMMSLTNDLICKVAFGRIHQEDWWRSELRELLHLFAELQGALSVGSFVPWLRWIDRVSGLQGKADRIAKKFDALIEGIVKEHVVEDDDDHDDDHGKGDESNGDEGERAKDLVDTLLETQRENTAGFDMDRASVKAIILDIFVAGTDTTFVGLEWAMSELLKNPRVLTKLQEEVRRVAKGKEIVNEDDLQKMEYLKAVIKETLRLHPPVPLLVSRESTKDVNIHGYHIAARTRVMINAWAIQRDPKFWEEPNEFRPERFLGSSVDFKGQDFQLIPFGAGRRSCPATQFASITMELILSNLVNAFDWKPRVDAKNEPLNMNESSGITIHRRDPLLAIATPCA